MTKQIKENYNQKYLVWAVAISLVLGFILFRNFLSVIIIGLITAFLTTPMYNWLVKKTKNSGLSVTLSLLATLLVVVIPIIIVIVVTIFQAKIIVDQLSDMTAGYEYHQLLQSFIERLNSTLSSISGRSVNITPTDIWDLVNKYASSVASFIVQNLTGLVGSVGSIVTNLILFMYIYTGVLINKEKLINIFKTLNPLGQDVSNIYLEKAGAMTKGMVGGQFTIAFVQGLISAITLYITGIPYFAFFVLILTFLSVIPLGAGIVTIPIGIVRIFMGDIWQGLLIVLGHLIVVTNIDNYLKPKLVPKSARLHPALILLSVFGGISVFGLLGIVIGPVLMVLITSTIEVYMATQKKSKIANPTKS